MPALLRLLALCLTVVVFLPLSSAGAVEDLAPNSAAAKIYGFNHLETLESKTTLISTITGWRGD
ncbi:hypothetical protein [Breoghania sp.]|uniref:hypothetical protein n=1 Tax=Breoghania sp. TaxID=2065378 RepID=UPI00262879D9|nr:hypothetical protein [Breoghania sp.]MDJ0931729.1 hypothetical protein [Breoghania sp.]